MKGGSGVRFGRPFFKLTSHQRQEAFERRPNGETLVDIARSYNVSHPTIMRLDATTDRLGESQHFSPWLLAVLLDV